MSLNLLSTLVGESRVMQQLYDVITQLAAKNDPVLILGEAATGKDSAAYELHCESSRVNYPFVSFNCASIPLELLETELFGHAQGAFPGAITEHKGRVALAEKGTLFLDEVDCLPMPIQLKLLTAMQQGFFYPIGVEKNIPCDVRVIFGAQASLKQRVDEGYFSAELFALFRNSIIHMPPLRERAEDLASLLQVLISKVQPSECESPSLDASVITALQNYDWPGNLRELECLVESLVTLYPGQVVTVDDLPTRYQEPHSRDQLSLGLIEDELGFLLSGLNAEDIDTCSNSEGHNASSLSFSFPVIESPGLVTVPAFDLESGISMKTYLQDVELQLIQGALHKAQGNVSQAAKLLQLNRTTLVEKIRKFGLKELDIA